MIAMAIFSRVSKSQVGYCLTGSGSRGMELSLDSGRLVDLLRSVIIKCGINLTKKPCDYPTVKLCMSNVLSLSE